MPKAYSSQKKRAQIFHEMNSYFLDPSEHNKSLSMVR